MKKVLIALASVLALFACSQEDLENAFNGNQEVNLVKKADYKIYSGKYSFLGTRAEVARGKKAMTGDVTVPEGAIDLCKAYEDYDETLKANNGYPLTESKIYYIPAGKTFDGSQCNLDVSEKNNAGGNTNIKIYVAGTYIATNKHNGTADVDITVLKGGQLFWDWTGKNENMYNAADNNNLYIGNGGAARIECYGKIGTVNHVQRYNGDWQGSYETTYDIKDLTIKGGSFLHIYKGDMEEFVVNGKFQNEKSNSNEDEFYSDIPVKINYQSQWDYDYAFQSNSASYVFNSTFECAGNMKLESGSQIYFNGCADINGNLIMSGGDNDIYVDKYLFAKNIDLDQSRMHLHNAIVEAVKVRVPSNSNNSYIEATSASAGAGKKKTATLDNQSILNVGELSLRDYQTTDYFTVSGLLGNNSELVVVSNNFNNDNGTTITKDALQATVKENVKVTDSYDYEKPNCDEVVPPTPEPVYYDLIVKVTEGQDEWGEVTGTEVNIPAGEFRQYTATAKDGYEFVGWTDGNTDPVRIVEMDSDKEFTAIFKEKENTPDPDDPYNNPEKPEYYENKAHVEVNLSVNDEKETGDYIATKLSIHVRDTTDVEVFIPVGADYYCEADDMYIVELHDSVYVYNELTEQTQIEVAGQTVTLTVTFENGGIRVTTDGINADVLKYCRENFGDGITFEVWNYYKDNTTRDDLKPSLDASTITFLDKEPDYYINAFAKLREYTEPIYDQYNEETGEWTLYTDEACTQELGSQYWERTEGGYEIFGHKNPWDCVVLPVESREDGFYKDEDCVTGEYNKNYAKVPETEE